MGFLNNFFMPIVLGICLCVGFVIKKWIKDVKNKYIPTIVAILGVFIASWINGWNITPDVVLGGLISGLASTGMHEMFSQYLKNK